MCQWRKQINMAIFAFHKELILTYLGFQNPMGVWTVLVTEFCRKLQTLLIYMAASISIPQKPRMYFLCRFWLLGCCLFTYRLFWCGRWLYRSRVTWVYGKYHNALEHFKAQSDTSSCRSFLSHSFVCSQHRVSLMCSVIKHWHKWHLRCFVTAAFSFNFQRLCSQHCRFPNSSNLCE